MGVSVLLLGMSYSKESDNDSNLELNEYFDNNLRVVMSSEYKDITVSDYLTLDVSVINRGDYDLTYNMNIIGQDLDELYYQIDDGEMFKVESSLLYSDELSAYGTANDHNVHKLTIYNESNVDKTITINIKENKDLLVDIIKNDSDVYLDMEDNYRYYGAMVNNYIKYDNYTYRIIGVINNRVKIISESKIANIHDIDNENYLSIYDYLKSFKNDVVTIDNVSNYDTWLNDIDSYWLFDTDGDYNAYYVNNKKISSISKDTKIKIRTIEDLYIDYKVVLGDGSKNSPYEVVYEG